METLLRLASVKPETLMTDEEHKFGAMAVADTLRRPDTTYETNQPRDYGNMSVLNASIAALKKLSARAAAHHAHPQCPANGAGAQAAGGGAGR